MSTTTGAGSGPGESAAAGQDSPIDLELASAIRAATAAGEWGVVAELARELGERRRERAAHAVPSLDAARGRKGRAT